MKFLVVDVETGGLDPQVHPLLSVGMVAVESGSVKSQFSVNIESTGTIDPHALKVNGIDIEKHDETALNSKRALAEIGKFLKSNFSVGDERIVLAGHNVGFDISFLKTFFLSQDINFSRLFDHRVIDTQSLGFFIHMIEGIEYHRVNSLDKLLNMFGIEVEQGKRHTALGDALATAKLIIEMSKYYNERIQ